MAFSTLVNAGSPMNTWNGTITAFGAMLWARTARPAWQSTTCVSAGMSLTGVWSTATSYFFSFLRKVLATMTLLPIPASQAMVTLRTSDPLTVGMCCPPCSGAHEDVVLWECGFSVLLAASEAHQGGCDSEAHHGASDHDRQHVEVAALRRHREVGEDAAR